MTEDVNKFRDDLPDRIRFAVDCSPSFPRAPVNCNSHNTCDVSILYSLVLHEKKMRNDVNNLIMRMKQSRSATDPCDYLIVHLFSNTDERRTSSSAILQRHHYGAHPIEKWAILVIVVREKKNPTTETEG